MLQRIAFFNDAMRCMRFFSCSFIEIIIVRSEKCRGIVEILSVHNKNHVFTTEVRKNESAYIWCATFGCKMAIRAPLFFKVLLFMIWWSCTSKQSIKYN